MTLTLRAPAILERVRAATAAARSTGSALRRRRHRRSTRGACTARATAPPAPPHTASILAIAPAPFVAIAPSMENAEVSVEAYVMDDNDADDTEDTHGG